MMNVTIEERPEMTLAYVRKTGAYGKETCEAAHNELISWAGPRGYCREGRLFSIYPDNPETTPAQECRTDACISVPSSTEPDEASNIGIQRLPGGRYAVFHFELYEDDFTDSWSQAFSWIAANGYRCADLPHYEEYINDPKDHPEHRLITDICIPLQ